MIAVVMDVMIAARKIGGAGAQIGQMSITGHVYYGLKTVRILKLTCQKYRNGSLYVKMRKNKIGNNKIIQIWQM